MKTHEWQSRKLLADYGIPISKGELITQPQEAAGAFARVANPTCISKVQVHMGGRGKAGGVRRAAHAGEVEAMCQEFLGKPFSTYQSAGQSQTVRSILVTADTPIKSEYYLGAVIDRQHGAPVLLVSPKGGVDIEEVAKTHPDEIFKILFHADRGADLKAVDEAIRKGFPDPSVRSQISDIAVKLSRLFVEKDAAICEINPLAETPDGRVIALDAKVVFDDNALFRHPDIQAMKDPEEEDARERKAKEFNLSYVSMGGNVGCLVNGAGLAMATMDMIKLAGGEPANFLDVGGGATTEQVREGFKIILQDDRVEAILVNIFGGIMKCDVIAEGVIQASKELGLELPLVVRLEGTRVEEGRKMLKESGLKIHACVTIEEAARAAVQEAAEYRKSHVDSRR